MCVLARIEEPWKPRLGMHDTEIKWVSGNVRNNNNVVTRNMVYVNMGHKPIVPPPTGGGLFGPASTHMVLVSSGHNSSVTVSLEMLTDRDIMRHLSGDLSPYMSVTLSLGDLYNRWAQAGTRDRYAAIIPFRRLNYASPRTLK